MINLKNIFWNNEQTRLHAGFRIIIQFAMFVGITISLMTLIKLPSDINGKTSLWVFLMIACVRLFRVLISVWIASRFLDRRPFADFGLHFNKDWWKDLCFGMGLGILLIGSIFVVELFAGWITISQTLHTGNAGQSFLLTIIVFAIVFLFVGFAEELFYRGYILTNLSEGFNWKKVGPQNSIILAVTFSSVLFGIFHIGSPNASLISTTNIILGGVLFSIPFILTGSLAIPVGIHITWNFFQANVFGFPVSGVTFPLEAVTFFSTEQNGPEIWTGGLFGPEAGLLSIFAFIAGILITIAWIRFRQGHVKLQDQLTQAPLKLLKNESPKII